MPQRNEEAAGTKRIIAEWSGELERCIESLAGLRTNGNVSEADHGQLEKLVEYARGFLRLFDKLDDEVSRINMQSVPGAVLLKLMCENSDAPDIVWRAFVLSQTERLDPENAAHQKT